MRLCSMFESMVDIDDDSEKWSFETESAIRWIVWTHIMDFPLRNTYLESD